MPESYYQEIQPQTTPPPESRQSQRRRILRRDDAILTRTPRPTALPSGDKTPHRHRRARTPQNAPTASTTTSKPMTVKLGATEAEINETILVAIALAAAQLVHARGNGARCARRNETARRSEITGTAAIPGGLVSKRAQGYRRSVLRLQCKILPQETTRKRPQPQFQPRQHGRC